MRPTSVYRYGRWWRVEELNQQGPELRPLHVISDGMDPIRSMASGRMHDSKSAYRAELKALGCIEVGNDAAASRPADTSKLWNNEPVEVTLKRAIEEFRR